MTAGRALVEIDLGAIARNWDTVRAAWTGSSLGAVVKNDAYGLGLAPVARLLAGRGCRDFWVAHLDEAIALRQLLPLARIFVLHGLGGAEPADFARHALVPVLAAAGELAQARAWAAASGRALPVAVHLDTGLSRLGLDRAAQQALVDDPAGCAGLDLQAWVTHLGRFTDPRAPQCLAQRERFLAWTRALPAAPRSIATSSCVFAGAGWHLEMARVGSALYGVDTTPDQPQPLQPVVTLHAPVLQVVPVAAGTEIGYGGGAVVRRATTLATLGLGYGDGLPTLLANRGQVFIDGRAAPIVGGVSMGFVSVDVGDFAPGQVRPGMRAQVYGPLQPVERLAAAAGEIPNALLLATASRALRCWREPAP